MVAKWKMADGMASPDVGGQVSDVRSLESTTAREAGGYISGQRPQRHVCAKMPARVTVCKATGLKTTHRTTVFYAMGDASLGWLSKRKS
jgi:hypothetical protein